MNLFNNKEDKIVDRNHQDHYVDVEREQYINEIDEDIKNRRDLTDDEKIKLHEERLKVNKDQVQTGEVTIDKNVITDKQEFDVPVYHEEVTIERHKVNRPVEDGHFDLNEEEIKVPIYEEKINVEKENVVAEELVIHKNKVQDVEHVNEVVRKEEVEIHDDQLERKNRHL